MTPFHLQPESVRVAKFKTAISNTRLWGHKTTPDNVFAAMWGYTSEPRFKRLSERPFFGG